MPRIRDWFVDRAVARLPESKRERFAEEWRGDLNERPDEIAKLLTAVGFLWAAPRMPSPITASDVETKPPPRTWVPEVSARPAPIGEQRRSRSNGRDHGAPRTSAVQFRRYCSSLADGKRRGAFLPM
jgi:hypothetical protein